MGAPQRDTLPRTGREDHGVALLPESPQVACREAVCLQVGAEFCDQAACLCGPGVFGVVFQERLDLAWSQVAHRDGHGRDVPLEVDGDGGHPGHRGLLQDELSQDGLARARGAADEDVGVEVGEWHGNWAAAREVAQEEEVTRARGDGVGHWKST